MKSMTLVVAALVALANAVPDSTLHMQHLRAFRRDDEPQGVEQPATTPQLNTQTVQGCFSSSGDLKFNTTQTYNSIGSCAKDLCLAGGFAVGGSTGGNQCWCGNTYPPLDTLVDDSKCNSKCSGYGQQACGGANTWTIYNTGLTVAVKYMPNKTDTSSTSSSSTPATAVVTVGGQTVVVTQSAAPESTTDSLSGGGGGSNVGGIVAGVVVGVVVIASAVGGVFLYMRRRRNQELEEEYRRNATVNDFFGKPPGSSGGMSTTDSRLDPVMAQRRLSDGSIADNQDYSRRILRVTNA